uniref:HMMR_C domain-containing protein n=1 Tax=Elaeophora elaphi TaxID=1147741 RepID=A0A158Q8S1_9BILA
MATKKKVEMEATLMSSSNSLDKLCIQYDQEMADIEVDLEIHDKLIKLMRENRALNQQQLLSIQKNTEQTEKELQLLDEKTNELVQSTNLQGEKIEELKRVQQRIMNGISDAQHCLVGAQNTVRDDLERLHSTERETQKFLESNMISPNFSSVASKLRNCEKIFSLTVQESIDHLASVKSIADEANHLEILEKGLEEMRLDASNLEGEIGEIDAQCSACHEKIVKLNEEQTAEKQRRSVISEKYKQRKRRVAELMRNLSIRKNDKKLLSESMNSKEQELNKNKERFEKKSAGAAAIQQEVDTIKDELAKLEDIIKFEHVMHEQKVQEIKETGEANICATKSVLMTLREKESKKLMQIQQARDDLNKKSELEAHKKINEEMERNLEQLKQEKSQLQIELDEKESRRNAQLSGINSMKNEFQENKLEASKKHEFLMGEVKRMSEQILSLQHKIAEEERRLKAQRNAVERQLNMMVVSKSIGTLIRSALEKDGKSRQDGAEAAHGSQAKGCTAQQSQGAEVDKVMEKDEESAKDDKPEISGNEEVTVQKTDPWKLPSKTKPEENEKTKSTFIVSEVKEPLLAAKKSEKRGETQMLIAEQKELKLSQPVTKYKSLRHDLVKKNAVSDTPVTASGSSKIGSQAHKKLEQKKEQTAHTKLLLHNGFSSDYPMTLFDSDISASTIKPMCASTPLLHKYPF